MSLNYRDGFPREIGCTLLRRTLPLDGKGLGGGDGSTVSPSKRRTSDPGNLPPAPNWNILIFVSGLANGVKFRGNRMRRATTFEPGSPPPHPPHQGGGPCFVPLCKAIYETLL